MWQKRYRQFKDTNWNRTCRKRGSNQKVPPYMSQNVSPFLTSGSKPQVEMIKLGQLVKFSFSEKATKTEIQSILYVIVTYKLEPFLCTDGLREFLMSIPL